MPKTPPVYALMGVCFKRLTMLPKVIDMSELLKQAWILCGLRVLLCGTFNRRIGLRKMLWPREWIQRSRSSRLSALDHAKKKQGTITYYFTENSWNKFRFADPLFDITICRNYSKEGFWIHKLINCTNCHHESSEVFWFRGNRKLQMEPKLQLFQSSLVWEESERIEKISSKWINYSYVFDSARKCLARFTMFYKI